MFSAFFGARGDGVQLPTETDTISGTNTQDANANVASSYFINPFKSINISLPRNPLSLGGDDYGNSAEVADESSSFLNLSYFERISLFIVCMLGCYACYAICFLFFPILSLKPKKFALIWSIGSILFLVAFAILNGPGKFCRHAITLERLPFTVSFVGSIGATLIFSLVWRHTLLVIVACIIQAVCSVFYTVSYFPYGRQGLRMSSGLARAQVEGWLGV